jgi:hypothetical protein
MGGPAISQQFEQLSYEMIKRIEPADTQPADDPE